MISRLNDLLEGRGENYILPFFWQHGEDEATLREYVRKIHESNIGAVCLEARPHPDYAGPQWWHDVDVILDECKKYGMKIWILDDSHFPTGFANGKMAQVPDELCKQYLYCQMASVTGPLPAITRNVAAMARNLTKPWQAPAPGVRTFDTDRLLYVTAVRTDRRQDPVDLTPFVTDGVLRWSVPAGAWAIYVIYFTQNGGGNPAYINMLDEASVRVLIDAVYEPHWARYQDEFGRTILGFFSDEPAIGNTQGFQFDEDIGNPAMQLPWSRHMPALMEAALGRDWMKAAPALWSDFLPAEITARVRKAYMDAVTNLVSRCFGGQLGGWCRDHGVQYIGHIVEDHNQDARLGPTLGHFFRALDGQDMAGIDDIGGQIVPGAQRAMRLREREIRRDSGEFFHYTLAKLGASLGHIDPKKRGRTMCECFGAYGWSCGVRDQWYIVNHLLARGVNWFVPHAFSPKAYPDPDCPPHYYAHGHNAQFTRFGDLMLYVNRMAHLLNGGTHRATAALLYHVDASWAGEAMRVQVPARDLMEHQIDFEIVPDDLFADFARYDARFDGQTLTVNGVALHALVVPYAAYLPAATARFIAQVTDFSVLFVGGLPEGVADAADPVESERLMAALRRCTAVEPARLSDMLRSLGLFDVQTAHPAPDLRAYLYEQEQPLLMLFNEDTAAAFDDTLWVAARGPVAAYDAEENCLRPVEWHQEGGGVRIRLHLGALDARLLVFGETDAHPQRPAPALSGTRRDLSSGWLRSCCRATDYPTFSGAQRVDSLENVLDELPDFSGYLCYEKQVELPGVRQAVLELEDAYEAPEVFVNGASVGRRLHAPYRFDLSGQLVEGKNTIRIELATTPAAEVQAMAPDAGAAWSGFQILPPSGILGRVTLAYN